MPTATGCALTVTAPLSVQAELADRPNPPTRPLPADPVVRRPKVTVGERRAQPLPQPRAVVLVAMAVVALARYLLCAGGACTRMASLMVTGLETKVTSDATPDNLVFPNTSESGVGNMTPPPKPASCLLSLSPRGLPSPYPRGSHYLPIPRTGDIWVTCLAQKQESRPQWYPPGLRHRRQQCPPRSTSDLS